MVKVIYYNCKKKIKILKKSLDFYKMVLYVVFRKIIFCQERYYFAAIAQW